MSIKPKQTTLQLRTLLDQLGKGQIRIDSTYQRSAKIWPGRAKSFLVETILLGMPIPRVLLHKIASPTTAHHTDIIDGQQRCTILQEYRRGRFALTDDVDAKSLRGMSYSQLPARLRAAFDRYAVPIDEYTSVTHKEIRHVFRRLNYYTAPLNAAEQRHAQFFGELRRFVDEECQLWRPMFEKLRVFTTMQVRRKANEQLMAEIVDAMLHGFLTPTATSLRAVYERYDRTFSSALDFGRRLRKARLRMQNWDRLKRTKLRKQYQMFSLIVAVLHAETNLRSVRSDLGKQKPIRTDREVLEAMEPLAQATRKRRVYGRYAGFWVASHEKTNVQANRRKRSEYFYSALTG
jgi:hypothetical protein